ncbi:MAG: stage II sporulation protein M [Bradyrhizobiaceae bacterium]|nr:stage II sporulation protein M [Hyphomicrobiales bacterium]MBV9429891.1 stage II sporulation protein M [Bradyrhizobiaceae bacterium]
MSTILATDTPIPPEKTAGRSELVLKSSEFRKGREASWRDLETLIERVERRGAGALSLEELQRLPILYRAALSSLSVARSIALDRNLLLYLENLALRAFLCVYGPRLDVRAGIGGFFARDLPAAVRGARWHILIAALCVIVGVAAGFLLAVQDESWVSTFVPSGLAGGRGPSSTRADLYDKEIFAPWPGFAASFGVFANVLFSHNTAVGLLAFGLGLAAGVPSAMLMVYQGLTLGSFLALHYSRDLTVDFLGWISIHGVTELTAIVLFAAAGLLIAEQLLFPGRYSRIESLALHGRQAGYIAVGAVLMLFVAAFLEGGCRQLVASTPGRFAIGFATGVFWFGYFGFAGRGADDARA